MRLRPDRASVLLTLAAVVHSWAVITLTPAWGLTTHAMIAAASGAIALCCRWGLRRLRLQHRRRRWAGSLPEALLVLGSLLRAHRVPERAIGTVAATAPAILTPTLARAEHAPHTDGGSVLAALQEALSAQAWTHPVCAQLRAAVDRADPGGFDRAERQVLAAERDRLHTAADRLQTQLTAVFLLGVFGPLAAVGLLPAASAGGLAVAPPTVAVIYHLWVPLGLLTGVVLIIVGPLGALHPPAPLEVPVGGLPRALPVGVSAGAAAGLVGHQVVPWAGPHLVVAVGVGVTAHVQTAPHLAGSHARTAIHTALPDLMATLAAVLTAGGAPERAIAAAAAPTPMGRVCTRVDSRLRAGASLSDALDAAVATAPTTPRLQRWAVHYRVAAGLGTAGGPLCASVAGAWRAADAVRTEALHRLGGLIRMCTHTGVVVGPIIAGTTVAMLGALTETTLTGRPLTPQAAGPPVASTVLTIALLLPALGVLLERGRVGAVVVRQAGHAVALAMVIFTITVHLVGRLI